MNENRVLKIGLFGVGHLGKFHLNNWLQINRASVVGFYDPNDAMADEVVKQYQLTRYTDVEKLMEDSDAIDIVAPTNLHYDLAAKALRLQKHVFVEKPLAATMEEARALVKLAKEARVKVQVGHVERFNPA
ncbi:MAG: Gfo/Idh/MocA family oxidoreductase, partial [Chitinophagaceae bacterium]|nr:Gfo/Idh/MocA family oxidoreductase [Chitinophagaceae bacterium]